MSSVSRLVGQLNITALEHSLSEIIHRHEVLRSTFSEVAGEPRQQIGLPLPLHLPIVDLQAMAAADREAKTQNIVSAAAAQGFDLSEGLLIRIVLIQLTPTEYVLSINIHHIVFDGWSFSLFFEELSALYAAFCQGELSPLPPLPIQYVDFAHWQSQALETAAFQSDLNYWKQQLGGALPLLQLPTDYPRPAAQDHRGDCHSVVLSASLTSQLKSLSQRFGATLFMTLLAALNVVLHRQSGQDDIIVGSPIAGRPRLETERLIGLFLNSLALRNDLGGNPSFEQLLERVRETTLVAYSHQEVPFERLVEELNPDRSLIRHPIFEVMLNFANIPETTWEMPGLSLSSVESDQGESKYTFTLYASERDGQLRLSLVYQRGAIHGRPHGGLSSAVSIAAGASGDCAGTVDCVIFAGDC